MLSAHDYLMIFSLALLMEYGYEWGLIWDLFVELVGLKC